jgi:hypothetical protein
VDQERVAFGEETQLFAKCTAYVNPVFRSYFHEIDVFRRVRHQFVEQRTAEPEAGAMYGEL